MDRIVTKSGRSKTVYLEHEYSPSRIIQIGRWRPSDNFLIILNMSTKPIEKWSLPLWITLE